MAWRSRFLLILFVYFRSQNVLSSESCPASSTTHSQIKYSTRYLLYTVNTGEGFNLRRDVYIRMSNLVFELNREGIQKWILVLPPWHRLYHWYNERNAAPAPWADFFDLPSLNQYVPVMELDQYIHEVGRSIDSLYILQHYAEGWGTHYEEKHDERPCIEEHEFRDGGGSGFEGLVSGRLMEAKQLTCLSVQGSAMSLAPWITKMNARSVSLCRAESVLHEHFAGAEFWRSRRSMRFAVQLEREARLFREQLLDTGDLNYGLVRPKDWKDESPPTQAPIGGPYLSVHLRRRDFVRAKRDQVPSIELAAQQLNKLLKKHKLHTLFLATDAPKEEVGLLSSLLPGVSVETFPRSAHLSDGQQAVVEQIIASRARYFIGSHESTFSYRIQEEREILGFPPNTTFNRLCGANSKCEQPAKWRIVY